MLLDKGHLGPMVSVPDTRRNADDREIVRISYPETRSTPLVFASPHSGRDYPPSFVRQSALSLEQLRHSEDAYIDALFAAAPEFGAPLVAACFPRVYLDPNRASDELDPHLIQGLSGVEVLSPSARTEAGLGIIPRLGAEGRSIYKSRLSLNEARSRVRALHKPYHDAVEAELATAGDMFGLAILIDAHSMPSNGARGADIVLGDKHGTSCASALTDLVEAMFRDQGFKCVRNIPYAGGYSTEQYGRPLLKRHAIQIEVNRGLYLNETRVTRSGTFDSVQNRISRVIEALAGVDWVNELG